MLIGAAFLPTFHIDYYTSITFDNVKTVEIAFIFMIYHHTIVLSSDVSEPSWHEPYLELKDFQLGSWPFSLLLGIEN